MSRIGSQLVFDSWLPMVRTAILLLGGDKSGQWNSWYETAIPAADGLYDEHLEID